VNVLFSRNLAEVFRLFLRQGVTAFGGPAAHIAMMHDETLKRRNWLSGLLNGVNVASLGLMSNV
jgi:chromate transport protein ChrA